MHDPAEDIDKLYLAVPVKDPESFVIRSAPLPFHIQDKKGKFRTVIGIMGIYRTILSFPVRLSVLISGSVFYPVIHLAFLFISIPNRFRLLRRPLSFHEWVIRLFLSTW